MKVSDTRRQSLLNISRKAGNAIERAKSLYRKRLLSVTYVPTFALTPFENKLVEAMVIAYYPNRTPGWSETEWRRDEAAQQLFELLPDVQVALACTGIEDEEGHADGVRQHLNLAINLLRQANAQG